MITEISVAVIGAIAAITVSLVGFIVAVTSAVIAKEQKLSEFRQDWINDLRNDCSQYFTLATEVVILKNNIEYLKNNNTPESTIFLIEKYKQEAINHREMFTIFNRISLRLNPEKDEVFLTQIRILLSFKVNDHQLNVDDSFKVLNHVSSDTHKILKAEWEVVKKGEKHFVFFRGLGEICLWGLITACFTTLLVLALSANFPQYCPIVG
jgi:hypothetical protein